MSKTANSKKRSLQTTLACAGLCILLGLGNMFFGYLKHAQYIEILSEATAELARPESATRVPLLGRGPALNIDKHTQHINRVKLRIDFYSIVILGGQALTALGGLLLVAVALMATRGEAQSPRT